MKTRFAHIAEWFEHLTPATLGSLNTIYAPGVRFRDPFNDISGCEAVSAVYRHMFDTLNEPVFVIDRIVADGDQAFMVWQFKFGWRGQPQLIEGCTHFRLNAQGLITLHRDYWDAAQELYEKLPLLGILLRALRRKMRAPLS